MCLRFNTRSNLYTPETIECSIRSDEPRLLASYSEGRPSTWTVDRRTKDLVALSVWMREELTRLGIDEKGRKVQENAFNRHSRSDPNLFVLAAQLMNDALADNIDRDRIPHKRWG